MEIYSLEYKNIIRSFVSTNINNMKRDKIIYYVSTVLLTAFMLFSVSMYFFKHDMIKEAFTSF
jgi:hypothetical protein